MTPAPAEAMVAVTFRLRPETDVGLFLDLSSELAAWLHRRPGFLRYELYRSAVAWTDTMTWADCNAARAGNDSFMKTELAHRMVALVEPGYRDFVGERVSLANEKVVA